MSVKYHSICWYFDKNGVFANDNTEFLVGLKGYHEKKLIKTKKEQKLY